MEDANKPTETQTPEVSTSHHASEIHNSQGNRKKLIFFVVAFFALVFGIAFYFIFQLNSPAEVALEPSKNSQQLSQPLTLSLESPTDTQVVEEGKLLVKGRTLPNTTVLIYSDDDQASSESDSNGYFEAFLQLTRGINTFVVTAYAESGEEKSVTADVMYDEEAQKDI